MPDPEKSVHGKASARKSWCYEILVQGNLSAGNLSAVITQENLVQLKITDSFCSNLFSLILVQGNSSAGNSKLQLKIGNSRRSLIKHDSNLAISCQTILDLLPNHINKEA